MKRIIALIYLALQDIFCRLLIRVKPLSGLILAPGFEKLRWFTGKMKVYREFERAKGNVPAYGQFLNENGYAEGALYKSGTLVGIPVMDKESYIKKYSIEERCVGGKIPARNVVIDESSGSSGQPTNWARGEKERLQNKRMLQLSMRYLLGEKEHFIINAFALGPWATGINVTMSFTDMAIMKSLGPDVQKICNTLNFFGSQYHYIIMGYPPFLKNLVDTAGIDWHKYDVTFIFGGESMTENMRTYFLDKGISKVYGSYGASDLELNIAAENDFTIALRRALISNPALGRALSLPEGSPIIFQFNPADFYIETNERDEIIISIARPNYLVPKIRYNIQDVGRVVRIKELKKAVQMVGIDIAALSKMRTDMPLLFHFGRADAAVAYFGSKIRQTDVQEAIFSLPEWSSRINSFVITTNEDDSLNKRLTVSLELLPGNEIKEENLHQLQQQLFDSLSKVNQDFREAIRMVPKDAQPTVEVFDLGQGPFAEDDIRIKHKYFRVGKKMA
jgi:phenylacetate-CoA ligase